MHVPHFFRIIAIASVLTSAAAAATQHETKPPIRPGDACSVTAGVDKADVYVKQCLEVSPATHPPCNAANACELIIDEIRRGCAMIERDAPAFCAEYRASK